MFRLCSKFQIGSYSFKGGVNEVKIKRHVREIMDTATITLPALSRIKRDDTNLPQSSSETAKLFREGDKVSIALGYNDELHQEFLGFVRRVNFGTPVTLELEGCGWQLRNKNILKSWKSTTLRQVLEEVVKGTDIKLSEHIPDVKLEKLYITNSNGLEVLEYLKKKLLLTVYFNFDVLYAGIEQGDIKGTAKYKLGWNVVKDDQLKYRLAEDTKVLVLVKRKLKKGEQLLYEVGDKDGNVHTINLPNVSAEDAKKIGDQALKEAKYTGYEGKITGFLQPYCEPGFSSEIIDPRYNERGGLFFIKGTEVTFGMRGARRIVEIGSRLNGRLN